jgi:hypothetical protein
MFITMRINKLKCHQETDPPPPTTQDQEDTSTVDTSLYKDCLHLAIAFFKQQMSLWSGRFLDEQGFELHEETYTWWKFWV